MMSSREEAFFVHSCNACANRNAVGALELETKCMCDEIGREREEEEEEEEEDANRRLSASFMFSLFSLSLFSLLSSRGVARVNKSMRVCFVGWTFLLFCV